MAWLKVETHTPDKPEVFDIADQLGIDADAAFGKCFRVWTWFDGHTTNGKPNGVGVSSSLLDRLAGVKGFANAMHAAGWLESDGDVFWMPNFDYHNGESAKSRALTAKRVANHAVKKNSTNANTNAVTVSEALPREEKIREEVNTSTNVDGDKPEVCPPCPIEEIISIYHEMLPTNPQMRVRTQARDKQISSRWKQFYIEGDFKDRDGGLDCFRWFFDQVRQSSFLTGQTDKPFFADLEWLTKSSNFAKVIEGKYHNGTRKAA
jgi:hypothetical protein